MLRGSCLCGNVSFELDAAAIVLFNNCFCSRCRKNTGSGNTAQLQVLAHGFRWLSQAEEVSVYESSPGVQRAFCRTCGSRVPRPNMPSNLVAVPAGTLDEDPGVRPQINMHTANRPGWAVMDRSIANLPGQGSEAFWRSFMQEQ